MARQYKNQGVNAYTKIQLCYAVIALSFFKSANITTALMRQRAIRIPQLYMSGILFHNIEGIELR